MKIQINQKIAKKARRYTDTCGCLLATAMLDAGAKAVSVGYNTAGFDDKRYYISEEDAEKLFACYDDGNRDFPFVREPFEVELIEKRYLGKAQL